MIEQTRISVDRPRRPPGTVRRALDRDLSGVDVDGRAALVARSRLLADTIDAARPDPKRQYLIPQLDRQLADALGRLGIGAVPGVVDALPWDEYLTEVRRVEEEERARAAAYRDAAPPGTP